MTELIQRSSSTRASPLTIKPPVNLMTPVRGRSGETAIGMFMMIEGVSGAVKIRYVRALSAHRQLLVKLMKI